MVHHLKKNPFEIPTVDTVMRFLVSPGVKRSMCSIKILSLCKYSHHKQCYSAILLGLSPCIVALTF